MYLLFYDLYDFGFPKYYVPPLHVSKTNSWSTGIPFVNDKTKRFTLRIFVICVFNPIGIH